MGYACGEMMHFVYSLHIYMFMIFFGNKAMWHSCYALQIYTINLFFLILV